MTTYNDECAYPHVLLFTQVWIMRTSLITTDFKNDGLTCEVRKGERLSTTY